MPVLSGQEIKQKIRERSLYVGPILDERQIGGASIDLRMGNIVLLVQAKGLSHVDPRNYLEDERHQNSIANQIGIRQKFDRTDLTFKSNYMLHPGALALVPTLEWVKLPRDYKGIVTARSSWAREGLNIATANFINPGYTGIITLELANLGQIPISLYPGLRVAQIAFHEVEGEVEDDQSQFNMSFEPSSGKITKGDEPFIPLQL